MKKVLSILNKTITWYLITLASIAFLAEKLTPIYVVSGVFVVSIIFGVIALIKISEKESVQINLSVNTEQRLKRIEEKLGLK